MKILPKPKSDSIDKSPSNEYLPSISFSLKQLPEAKDWEVGKSYTIKLKVLQTGYNEYKGSDGRASFEVEGVEVCPEKPMKLGKKATRYKTEEDDMEDE